jgi:hypothetical protein
MYTVGMGNIFTAALRRAMYALLPSDSKDTLEMTIRNMAGLQNWYYQMRNILDTAQLREGNTNFVVSLQNRLDAYRATLTRFDDSVRAAVEQARADGQSITTTQSSAPTLGLWPLLIIAGAAVAIVAVYTAITQGGATMQTAIDDAFALQQSKAQIAAMVEAHNTAAIANLPAIGANRAAATGGPSGGGGAGNRSSLLNIDFGELGIPLLVVGGVAAFLWFRNKNGK